MKKLIYRTYHINKIILLVLTPLLLTGCMSIQTAARFGNMAEVKKQLAWGVSPNTRTLTYLVSPLHEAAGSGYANVVELLLEHGANVNITDEGGSTPLHWAAENGHTKVMKILLENEADPSMKGTGCGTPMQWAVRNGQIRSVKTLLDFGVDVDQKGSGNRTALMEAVSNEDVELIEFLLEKGADVNVTTGLGYGCSPLHIAAHLENFKIGRILLEHGADPNFVCEGKEIPQLFIKILQE